MSASEKLKRLAAGLDTFVSTSAAWTEGEDHRAEQADLIVSANRALPALIAVVEAAEDKADEFGSISSALADLDDALGDVT